MNENIFGCYVQFGFDPNLSEDDFVQLGKVFNPYIWGVKGICNLLKRLRHEDYGKDLLLILLQFYVNPTPDEIPKIRVIESYRKKEKSIGIPIIINEENFFSQTEEARFALLKKTVTKKIHLLADVVKNKKLDTNMDLLNTDMQKIFE
jgi:hypothetical protein